MPLVFLFTVTIALYFWEMSVNRVLASTLQGLAITAGVLWIIFGAILLLNTLKHSGAIQAIRAGFITISPDRRVQAIIIAWLFGSFIEGASGFGTTAAIVAPLLVAIGFPAMAALMLGMLVQSTPVSFGAVGTPIIIGITGGLDSDAVSTQLLANGSDWASFMQLITSQVAIIHAIVGTIIPLIMVLMLTRFFGQEKSWKAGFAILPFALFAGLAFTIPYAATGILLGPEFPSMLGGLVGLAIVTTAARFNFLTPKSTWDFAPAKDWPSEWLGSIEMKLDNITSKPMSSFKAWLPYVLVGVLLVISRVSLPVADALKAVTLKFPNILGEAGINADFMPLYLPGGILIVVACSTYFLHKMPWQNFRSALSESSRILLGAGFVLLFTIPMVRILINSGINAADIPSMPITMARFVADSVGAIYPLLAPSIGALGAFIAGSNTVSNMMFSQFQFGVAENLGISTALVIAGQAIGAAAGNMIAIHNVVAASATVGLLGQEGTILRKTIWPTLYYVFFTGLIVLLAVTVLGIRDPLMP
ncbi:MAG: L-lactate permease, partial [Gammaproteobacteria bacterium]|nr:L-lactate permease [Gammaproteobacteria bacterium]